MFNTAQVSLFDRSFLHTCMSLNQVELTLKNNAPKSRTPVSMYKFDILWTVKWKIMKTFHVQIFFVFSITERIRKGSDLPKKKWGSPSSQQKYLHKKLTQRSSALYFVEFRLGARAWNTWHGSTCLMNSVHTRDAQ